MVKKKLTEKAKQDLKIIELGLTKGDPRAYNNLMSKYRDPIFFMLYEIVNNKELAKELTIEIKITVKIILFFRALFLSILTLLSKILTFVVFILSVSKFLFASISFSDRLMF